MKNNPILLNILIATRLVLFLTGLYVFVMMTNGQINIEKYWLWFIAFSISASGQLYLARDLKL
jgi:hypothetical protein